MGFFRVSGFLSGFQGFFQGFRGFGFRGAVFTLRDRPRPAPTVGTAGLEDTKTQKRKHRRGDDEGLTRGLGGGGG